MNEIIKKNSLEYSINDKSVVLKYGSQFIAFSCYNKQSHKKFNRFKNDVINSKEDDLQTVPQALKLARKYDVYICGSTRSTIILSKVAF
jgi:hypothetical protein